MRTFKKVFHFMFSRLFLVALMIVLQVVALLFTVTYFSQYVYFFLVLISLLAALAIINNDENPIYKLNWVVAILTFPVVGGIFYIIFGNKRMPRKLQRQIDATMESMQNYFPSNESFSRRLQESDPQLAIQSKYIQQISGYPLCANTSAWYFPVGELMFQRMLSEMKLAKRYIMLEYFIVDPGYMWDTMFKLLRQKMREGVEVYMMYDDLGSISTLPAGYDEIIRRSGIRLQVFNPFRPRLSMLLNYRDHRKLLIIDGKAAFTGGINLADEYINRIDRFGHWKDTGVLLKGEAAWQVTLMYLQQWQFASGEKIQFQQYHPDDNMQQPSDGLVQVFGDSPLDNYNVTEIAYLNIISRATKYVYITTPYLIIDYEMEQALCAAAASGIDVRIITPYRYDKWYVHMVTRSHYKKLVAEGVKIYEYTPGFMHGKMFVSDDNICMVGTCNMDFRSFYLHFECSVAFYHSRIIQKVKRDIVECQKLSHRITLDEMDKVRLSTRLLRAVLKVFAPLM